MSETVKRIEQLANDYASIADEIGHKLGDSDALFLLKGVVIGMRRCVNELRSLEPARPGVSGVDTSMEELRKSVNKARGGGQAPQHKGFA